MDIKKYDIMILSGGFDPVHKGHVRMFKAAKNQARKVIVGINSDEWLIRKKGKGFMNFAERAEIIKAFRFVDEVMRFNDKDDTAIGLLTHVQMLYPECSIAFGNGGDRNDKNTPEKGFCDAYNIDMVWQVGGGKVQSSSNLISKSEPQKIPLKYVEQLNDIKTNKLLAVKNSDFELAANLRQQEKDILKEIEQK